MTHRHLSGLTLTVLGTLALLQVMGIYYFGLALWPAVLLWIGLEMTWGSLLTSKGGRSVMGIALGLFVGGIGLVQILANTGLMLPMSIGELIRVGWPALLIALGISLFFKRSKWHVHCDW